MLYLRHANVTEYSLICFRNSLSQRQRAKELRNRSGMCCMYSAEAQVPKTSRLRAYEILGSATGF